MCAKDLMTQTVISEHLEVTVEAIAQLLIRRRADARRQAALDVMTPGGVDVKAETPAGHVAWLMAQRDLKRAPAAQVGVPVGLVTQVAIVRSLTGEKA